MNIQRADESDLEAIEELENALFDNSMGIGTLRRELRSSWAFIAVEGVSVLGYLIVRPDPRLSDVLRLGVAVHAQGKGVGKALLEHVLQLFPWPMVLMVRHDNEKARRLYKRAGFRVVGTTEQSWVMQR